MIISWSKCVQQQLVAGTAETRTRADVLGWKVTGRCWCCESDRWSNLWCASVFPGYNFQSHDRRWASGWTIHKKRQTLQCSPVLFIFTLISPLLPVKCCNSGAWQCQTSEATLRFQWRKLIVLTCSRTLKIYRQQPLCSTCGLASHYLGAAEPCMLISGTWNVH